MQHLLPATPLNRGGEDLTYWWGGYVVLRLETQSSVNKWSIPMQKFCPFRYETIKWGDTKFLKHSNSHNFDDIMQ